MIDAKLFIVIRVEIGSAACHGGMVGNLWQPVDRRSPPPMGLRTWETRSGAEKFSGMNGGTVTTVMEHFYSPAVS